MALRDEVETLLPGWEQWYPSLFDAAVDLGVLRARVCPPSALLLSRRHAAVTSAAVDAHRENWGGVLADAPAASHARSARKARGKRSGRR